MMKNFATFLFAFFLVLNKTEAQNNALQFDGADDRVIGTMSALPQGNAPRTIEAWIKNSTGNDMTIFNYGTGADNQLFTLHLYNGVYIIGYNNDISTGFAVNNGAWHHLAVTHDGTTTKVYVDGTQRGSKTTTYNTTGTNFQIGASFRSAYQFHYNGTIDEVRVWNIARTQSEIQATMNYEIASASGLIANYHFNQGSAGNNNSGVTTLTDATGSYNGTLSNFALNGTTSNWVSSNVVLSTEFLNFNAQNTEGGNLLTWQTATETNSSHFDIERSHDGFSFQKIGEIKAQGKAATYQFVDDVTSNMSYYRIKEVSFDKKETLSKVVSISTKGNNKLKVYPSVTTVFLNVQGEEGVNFDIINILGQSVLTGKVKSQIDVSQLAKGHYWFKTNNEVVQFVKE